MASFTSLLIEGRQGLLWGLGRPGACLSSGSGRPHRPVSIRSSSSLQDIIQLPWGASRPQGPIPVDLPATIVTRWPTVWPKLEPDPWVAELKEVRVAGGDGWVIDGHNQLLSEPSHRIGQCDYAHPAFRTSRWDRPVSLSGTTALLACSHPDNYYHWTFDALPKLKQLAAIGVSFTRVLAPQRTAFQRESLQKILGASVEIIPLTSNAQWLCETLLVASEPGMTGNPSQWMVAWLRDVTESAASSGDKKLYISRGKNIGRGVANEADFVPDLLKSGFEFIEPAQHAWNDQIRLFAQASFIVAPHGAGLANLAFCKPGTHVLECFNPAYVNVCYASLCAVADLRYDALFGSRTGRRNIRSWREAMSVSPEALKLALQKNFL